MYDRAKTTNEEFVVPLNMITPPEDVTEGVTESTTSIASLFRKDFTSTPQEMLGKAENISVTKSEFLHPNDVLPQTFSKSTRLKKFKLNISNPKPNNFQRYVIIETIESNPYH
jgi:hypothetical protein